MHRIFRIEVCADTRFLEMIGNMVEIFCRSVGLEEDDAKSMQLAVDEICTNTVLHGYGGDSSRCYIVEGFLENKKVAFKITEWGKPFDISQVPEPDLESPLEQRRIGGLGIFLARKLCDRFDYLFQHDGTKCFLLEKNISGVINQLN